MVITGLGGLISAGSGSEDVLIDVDVVCGRSSLTVDGGDKCSDEVVGRSVGVLFEGRWGMVVRGSLGEVVGG